MGCASSHGVKSTQQAAAGGLKKSKGSKALGILGSLGFWEV